MLRWTCPQPHGIRAQWQKRHHYHSGLLAWAWSMRIKASVIMAMWGHVAACHRRHAVEVPWGWDGHRRRTQCIWWSVSDEYGDFWRIKDGNLQFTANSTSTVRFSLITPDGLGIDSCPKSQVPLLMQWPYPVVVVSLTPPSPSPLHTQLTEGGVCVFPCFGFMFCASVLVLGILSAQLSFLYWYAYSI